MQLATDMALIAFLAAASTFDLRERRIPNALVLAMAGVWVLLQIAQAVAMRNASGFLGGVASAAVIGGGLFLFTMAFEAASGKFALGGGDLKLITACALYLGVAHALVCVAVACCVSLALAVVVPRTRFAHPADMQTESAAAVPFAPALLAGALIATML